MPLRFFGLLDADISCSVRSMLCGPLFPGFAEILATSQPDEASFGLVFATVVILIEHPSHAPSPHCGNLCAYPSSNTLDRRTLHKFKVSFSTGKSQQASLQASLQASAQAAGQRLRSVHLFGLRATPRAPSSLMPTEVGSQNSKLRTEATKRTELFPAPPKHPCGKYQVLSWWRGAGLVKTDFVVVSSIHVDAGITGASQHAC